MSLINDLGTLVYDIAILNIKSVDYHCIISGTRKSEAMKSMKNIVFTEKNGTL